MLPHESPVCSSIVPHIRFLAEKVLQSMLGIIVASPRASLGYVTTSCPTGALVLSVTAN